ncbi:hypothetical protein EXW93_12800 [Exiguobacterium sp. JMULE1]|uniref:hypothetical protein n=1 Tax=Exiguobacterium sp. JMULE1 TaxID=2518339 RepID=UPI0015760219|nr:hypothetical protein [Exiguobacterium sp. JMULE1]NTY10474.1 hypothetical protein [Exiguobacterium sp. JMULE1]
MNIQLNPARSTVPAGQTVLSETKTYKGTVLEQTGPHTALVQVGRDKIEMTFTGEVPTGDFQFKVKGQTAEGYLIEQLPAVSGTDAETPSAVSIPSNVDPALLEGVPAELKPAVAKLLASGQLPQTPEVVAQLVMALQGSYKDLVLELVSRPDNALPPEAELLIDSLLATTEEFVDVLPERDALRDQPTFEKVVALDVARVTLPTQRDIEAATPLHMRQYIEHLPAKERPALITALDQGDVETVRKQLTPYFPQAPLEPKTSVREQLIGLTARAASPVEQATPIRSALTLVREVTPRLAEVTNDFKSQQRTIVSQLRQIEPLVESRPVQMVAVIESTAHRLKQMFQQTDAMLHTTMRDEKQLIHFLSKLERGAELASHGRGTEAKALLQEVRTGFEAFRYAPANVRPTYLPEWNASSARTPNDAPAKLIPYEPKQNSPRVLQETVQKALQLQSAELKLAAPTLNPEASKLQSFLTTQQQINKPDNQQQLNQILLSLPVQIVEATAGLHVHLQNKRPDEVIDWENNTLYVQLNTKRLGDIGVRVETVNRKMQITIENDLPILERLATPFLERTTDALEATGYQDVRIQFRPFTKEERQDVATQKDETPNGYDYRI